MAPPRRPDAELKRLAELILSYPKHTDAATAIGLSHIQTRRIVYDARARGLVPEIADYAASIASTATLSPVEIRNERFWKERATALAAELSETNHILAQVSGMMERIPTPPVWALPKPSSKAKRASGLLHISDIHAGEVVRAEEINGLNAFDIAICRRRLRRMFAASIDILPRWASDCRLEGIVNAINGDLISGDIHEDLRETNELASLDQSEFVTDELIAGITHQAKAFDRVDAYFTIGNHGRQTHKTRAKRTAALNYDNMIGKQVARHFATDKRVTIHVSPSRDCEYSILGHRVLQTHGDQGGGGGQGFAGPVLPVLRNAKKIEHKSAQTRNFYDIILTGHRHVSTHPTRKHFGNGSVPGYNEFASSILADPEPPMQWLLLITEKWGVRERLPIVLDELGGWT